MAKIRPFVFGIADAYYAQTYVPAFLNSANAAGHGAYVHVWPHTLASTKERADIALERFRLLPKIVEKHGPVLVMDVDAIFQKPIEIDDEYDLGLFLREYADEERYRVLASISYFTDRAVDFMNHVAEASRVESPRWCDDQAFLWRAYAEFHERYNIKRFDRETLDWVPNKKACVYTAKGPIAKNAPAYQDALYYWTNNKPGAA